MSGKYGGPNYGSVGYGGSGRGNSGGGRWSDQSNTRVEDITDEVEEERRSEGTGWRGSMRKGDWRCPCGGHNYRSRWSCFLCNTDMKEATYIEEGGGNGGSAQDQPRPVSQGPPQSEPKAVALRQQGSRTVMSDLSLEHHIMQIECLKERECILRDRLCELKFEIAGKSVEVENITQELEWMATRTAQHDQSIKDLRKVQIIEFDHRAAQASSDDEYMQWRFRRIRAEMESGFPVEMRPMSPMPVYKRKRVGASRSKSRSRKSGKKGVILTKGTVCGETEYSHPEHWRGRYDKGKLGQWLESRDRGDKIVLEMEEETKKRQEPERVSGNRSRSASRRRSRSRSSKSSASSRSRSRSRSNSPMSVEVVQSPRLRCDRSDTKKRPSSQRTRSSGTHRR
jgi:hypothetical protein